MPGWLRLIFTPRWKWKARAVADCVLPLALAGYSFSRWHTDAVRRRAVAYVFAFGVAYLAVFTLLLPASLRRAAVVSLELKFVL
jgi:hypothetical protein